MNRRFFLITGFLAAAAMAFAGGEMSEVTIHRSTAFESSQADFLQRNLASRQKALYQSQAAAMAEVRKEWARVNNRIFAPGPYQDKYGDPMYTAYGPIVGADSPMYNGPRYVASFDRYAMLPVPDGNSRVYYRQAYSHPGLTTRTDVSMGVGATQSYMQHGMMTHPGSMAPSAARAMTNNRW